MGMTRSHGVLLLAAVAECLVPPIRSSLIRPRTVVRAIPLDAVDAFTTQTLAANSALTSTADELAGRLFGASLLPWLAMLYWLGHPKANAPPGVTFGLQYLLLFVFGSVPAALGADALFHASLADVDWLHGAAGCLRVCSGGTCDDCGAQGRFAVPGDPPPRPRWLYMASATEDRPTASAAHPALETHAPLGTRTPKAGASTNIKGK